MQRGVISTSPAAIAQLLQFLQIEKISDQALLDRLNGLANTTQDSIDMQINGEEAELFLDILPPPTSSNSNELLTLRRAIQNFLSRSN